MTGALEVQATEELTSLYELHAPLVRRVCRRMLGDAPDLDDAVQLTFLRAYRSLLRGSGPREADAWLTAIARNVCRTQLRERLERPAEELDDADLPLTPALTEEADRREDINAVLSAVGDLPRREREAVVLQAFAGFSNAEAAVLLGTTESGVESLLQRARARLRVVVAPTRSLGLAAPWVRSVFAALGRGDGIAAPLGAAAVATAVIVFLAPAPVGRAGPPAATRPAGTTSPISRPSVRPAVAVARRRPAGRVVLSLPGRLRGAATSQIPAREAIASETSAASESTGPAAAAPTPAPTTAPAPAAPATSSNPAQAGGSTTATSTAAAMTVPLTGVGTEDANADASVTASATTGSDGSVSVSADASVEVSVTTPVVTTTTEVSGGVGVDLP